MIINQDRYNELQEHESTFKDQLEQSEKDYYNVHNLNNKFNRT